MDTKKLGLQKPLDLGADEDLIADLEQALAKTWE
jgi:hypothetical protein